MKILINCKGKTCGIPAAVWYTEYRIQHTIKYGRSKAGHNRRFSYVLQKLREQNG